MVTLSDPESELVEQLLGCLADAMGRADGIEVEYANETKLQKLLYLAIDEFDVPITYSWYLAGSIVESDSVATSTVRTAFDELSEPDTPTGASTKREEGERDDDPDEVVADDERPMPPVLFDSAFETDATAQSPTDPDGRLDQHVERDEVVDFYTSVLPEVWFQSTMRFLQNFYLNHAPPEYRDLYLASVQLRTNLSEFEAAVEAAVTGETHHRSREEIVHGIELQVSELHLQLAGLDPLSETFDAVVSGTDLIEHALVSLASVDDSTLTREHLELVGELVDFFYYAVWRYPCLVISRETATGPSATTIEDRRTEQLETAEAKLRRRRSELEDRVAVLSLGDGVAPEPIAEEAEGELTDQFSTLSEEYLRR
jgi:hypothetical protein